MQHWLDKLIDLASLRGDESILKDALTHLAQQTGFPAYAYLYIRPAHTMASSNYPTEWWAIYFNRKYETIDPIVKRAKSVRTGVHVERG
jgi:LuxR family transcriptional regulator, activator of conjugal transfer of Ti plasmids